VVLEVGPKASEQFIQMISEWPTDLVILFSKHVFKSLGKNWATTNYHWKVF